MIIKQNQTMSPLHEADSIIDKSVEISDSESNNSVNFVPLIATESGSNAINISDILDFCEKENMPARTAIREICEYNNIDTISFYVSESDYIESDKLRHMANLLQESGEDVYKVPISNNNPIYICANEAIDELAYNDNSSLLESFMEDDYAPFSDSIYDSIINEAKGGHGKRGGSINKARKLTDKAPTATATNDSDEQQEPQEPNTTQPTPNGNQPQSSNNNQPQQNDADTNIKSNNNNGNQPQPQTQNTAQQQKQPNTNNSAQPTPNGNQPQSSNNQQQQNDDQQDQQKEKQQETQVENVVNNMEKSAENKPAGFISSKIAALRKLYQNWLAKKNQEHDQGKIGFFSNILRVITNCIDRLLAKLQGVKKAENNAMANNNAAGGANNNNSTTTSSTNTTAPQQQNP